MQYKNDALGVSFEIPDSLTVGKQLEYKSGLVSFGDVQGQFYTRFWCAVKAVIEKWECDYMALDVDLGTATDPRIAKVIEWAAMKGNAHMNDLVTLPKN